MGRQPGQFASASALGILAAIQAAILSAPLSFLHGLRHAPKSEFAGLAVFGYMVFYGAVTAAIVLVIVFTAVFAFYTPGSTFFRRAVRSLLASIACGIAAIVITAAFGGGPEWAMALGGISLVVGIVYSMQGYLREID
jgi:hypothetical protein